jgi:hypothetical protein
MAKAKLRFTENDVARAIRAVSKAGVRVGRVELDPAGNIVVVAAEPGDDAQPLERPCKHKKEAPSVASTV